MSILRGTHLNSTIGASTEGEVLLNCYQFFMVTAALIGNSIVLYFTTLCTARHPKSAPVLLVLNLAVADLSLLVIVYLPKMLTLNASRWVLGSKLCHLAAFSQLVPGVVETVTLATITIYRWYTVRFPFRRVPGMSPTKVVILLIWCVAIFSLGLFVTASSGRVVLNTNFCTALVELKDVYLTWLALFFLAILPVTLTLVLNLYILVCTIWVTPSTPSYNKQAASTPLNKRSLVSSGCRPYNKRALGTVSAACCLLVLSWTPYILGTLLPLPPWFYVSHHNLNLISLTFNPWLYAMTNRKLWRFLLKRTGRIEN